VMVVFPFICTPYPLAVAINVPALSAPLKTTVPVTASILTVPVGSVIAPLKVIVRPRRLPLGRHRRHPVRSIILHATHDKLPSEDRPLRLESKARGLGVSGRIVGRTKEESEFYLRQHDDGDGEIEHDVERRDR